MDSNVNTTEQRAALVTYQDVAGLLEHHLTRPDLNEEEVNAGCHLALRYGVATCVVRPSDVDMAVRILSDSPVHVASVVGFPHGSSSTGTKLYEGRDLLRRGAREVSLVVNFGKMISRQFQHVETEILQMSESCHQAGATLKVIFENGYLADDLRNILCKMCKRTDTDFAETATGFGPESDTFSDLAQMKAICKDAVRLKAFGGISTLDQVFAHYAAGCDRMGTTETAAILDAWKAVLAEREAAAKQAAVS